jgi:endonuclease YncB( thermonuclease family)
MRFLLFAVLSLLPFAAPAKEAPPAKPFQKIEGCTWKADRWNDGDSFHVITGHPEKEMIIRLYFVDAPEAETAYRARLKEQAAYFRISQAQAILLAQEAAAFTQKRLTSPFTVWTRGRSALGRSALGRVYGIVITGTGEDLNRLLVANGLARIYGVKTVLFDGRDSKTYVASLKALELQAKKAKVGGWRFRRGS